MMSRIPELQPCIVSVHVLRVQMRKWDETPLLLSTCFTIMQSGETVGSKIKGNLDVTCKKDIRQIKIGTTCF